MKRYAKAGLILLFLILTIFFNGKAAYDFMKERTGGIGRILPEQYAAAECMRENLPKDADVAVNGVLVPAKKKWLMALSQRHMIYDYNVVLQFEESMNLTDHVYVDSSEMAALGRTDLVNALAEWEQSLKNFSVVCSSQNIRVYKIG